MVNGQCLTTMVTSSRGPRDKIWDLMAFVWPIRRWLQPIQFWLSAGISSVAPVLVSRNRDLSNMYSYIPLDLNQLPDVGVDQWFQVCIVDTHQRICVMVKGLLCQLVNSFISVYATMAWYPAETNMCAFVIQQPEEVHDMANKRVLSVFTLNRLQAGHWVRVNYYIVVDCAHVW